jgi:hypothetical protein
MVLATELFDRAYVIEILLFSSGYNKNVSFVTNFKCKIAIKLFLPVVKQPGRETNHSSPYNAKL